MPTEGWEQFGQISLNKSARGSQGAEAMVYWTRVPAGSITGACQGLNWFVESSVEEVAAAVASAPGTDLIEAPSNAVVGGLPANRLMLSVREDNECDPGFFYAWDDAQVGALWPETTAGDTIRVWIVDLDGSLLFIGGLSKPDAGEDVEAEIETIVESIRVLRLLGPG